MNINYDHLMVNWDLLSVDKNALKIVSNRKYKEQITSENN